MAPNEATMDLLCGTDFVSCLHVYSGLGGILRRYFSGLGVVSLVLTLNPGVIYQVLALFLWFWSCFSGFGVNSWCYSSGLGVISWLYFSGLGVIHQVLALFLWSWLYISGLSVISGGLCIRSA